MGALGCPFILNAGLNIYVEGFAVKFYFTLERGRFQSVQECYDMVESVAVVMWEWEFSETSV